MPNKALTANEAAAGSSTMRGADRTLRVLRALNEHNGSNVSEIAGYTQISRPALYRILSSLCLQGYVRRRSEPELYELTPLVRSLSDGYREEDWLRQAAVPVIEALQLEVVWPTDLATFHGNAMYLRETTRRKSPMTIDGVTVGLRLPMLRSATGKAYLAACPEAEQALILTNLRSTGNPDDALSHDSRFVKNLVATTRRLGYGERQEDWIAKTGAIAIPVRQQGRVLACLNITFIASVLTPKEAAARYLGKMQAAAKAIESASVPR
ncbi:MAG: IclR family transcriptional regulator domain-containing protein [Rhodoferax sp.]